MRTHSKAVAGIAAAMVLSTILPPVTGEHGWGECPDWTIYLPADAETTSSPVYVMVDEVASPFGFFGIIAWVYAESNGVEGLQRDDEYCHHVDAEGQPYTGETADRIIF